MLAPSSLSSAERRDMSRYTLLVILLVAMAFAAIAGNIIWGE
jgi:hypothetical protein